MEQVTQAQELAPFQRASTGNSPALNVGSVAIEQERAIAEAQGQMIIAKRFPRDPNAAYNDLMSVCKIPAMAEVAFYSLPRGNSVIAGPSIRLAEEIARCWGNIEYGHRELSRSQGKSEVEVYAWDKETNTRSIRQLTVMHSIDTKQGPRPLRDQKEIDDRISNVASKQVRGRILALMPKWLVVMATDECQKTLAGNNAEPLISRVRKALPRFAEYGVTQKMIEQYLGHEIASTTAQELTNLQGVFNALREGEPVEAYFQHETTEDAAKLIESTATANQAAKPEQGKPAVVARARPAPKPAAAQAAEAGAEPEKASESAQKTVNPVKDKAQPAATKKPDQTVNESAQQQQEAAEPEDEAPPADDVPPPDADTAPAAAAAADADLF